MDVPDWTREYFERGYAQRWGLKAPTSQVEHEVSGLWKLLQISPKSRVLDVGCGHGRHALVLAGRGVEVIGIDVAVALLNRAKHLAADLGTRGRWVRGDMRQLPFRSGCASAAIVMDALGFFDTEEENEAVLLEAARVLKSGGRLALKVVNGGAVLDAFREAAGEERDGVVVTISRTLTFNPLRMTEKISIRGSRGHGEYERRQRLYLVEELRATLERLRFFIAGVFADPQGTPFERASTTIWIVAHRDRDDERNRDHRRGNRTTTLRGRST